MDNSILSEAEQNATKSEEMRKLGNIQDQIAKMREMAILAEGLNKKPCKKCFGRGYESFHIKMNQYIPCACVVKAAFEVIKQKKREQCESRTA